MIHGIRQVELAFFSARRQGPSASFAAGILSWPRRCSLDWQPGAGAVDGREQRRTAVNGCVVPNVSAVLTLMAAVRATACVRVRRPWGGMWPLFLLCVIPGRREDGGKAEKVLVGGEGVVAGDEG
jgi:hypothetical protein